MSLAGSITGGLVGGSGGYEAYERITNGGFADSSVWVRVGTAWVIGGGVATRSKAIGSLRQDTGLVNSGRSVAVSVDVTNAVSAAFVIALLMDGLVTQIAYSDTPATGALAFSVEAAAEFNGIQFASTGATGLVIDNVSVIA